MKNRLVRTLSLVAACGLAIAGCADKPTRGTPTPVAHPVTGTTPAPTTRTTGTSHGTTKPATPRSAAAEALPANTGIASCDNYLASYKSCHRVAGIYRTDEIDSRYDMMRTTLLRDSKDDDMRPQLDARCTSLATQLKQALHGKSCAQDEPASASTAAK